MPTLDKVLQVAAEVARRLFTLAPGLTDVLPWAAGIFVCFCLVIWIARRRGERTYRTYRVILQAASSLLMIISALVSGVVGYFAAKIGWAFVHWQPHGSWQDVVTVSNGIAVMLGYVSVRCVMRCVTGLFEALPGISPRVLPTGPGTSRLASRREQRRAKILG